MESRPRHPSFPACLPACTLIPTHCIPASYSNLTGRVECRPSLILTISICSLPASINVSIATLLSSTRSAYKWENMEGRQPVIPRFCLSTYFRARINVLSHILCPVLASPGRKSKGIRLAGHQPSFMSSEGDAYSFERGVIMEN